MGNSHAREFGAPASWDGSRTNAPCPSRMPHMLKPSNHCSEISSDFPPSLLLLSHPSDCMWPLCIFLASHTSTTCAIVSSDHLLIRTRPLRQWVENSDILRYACAFKSRQCRCSRLRVWYSASRRSRDFLSDTVSVSFAYSTAIVSLYPY